ncbi:MAG TPA: 23S rRNA (guanosine(2251)-2'-O)-methyltransferase RlmB [Chromatiales bacterium]|nr:23S rRNA (guanosine(2251)-2'-O)-methyltransferase RlmB [Chromatiales bacterium]
MEKPRLIFGLHSVRTALRNAGSVETLWVDARRRDRRIGEIRQLARQSAVAVKNVDRDELDRLSGGANHQGVVARVRGGVAPRDEAFLWTLLERLEMPPFLLILDGVQDPHNLGACLRTADGAGVHAVIVAKDRSVGLTSTVCKVASGAAEHVPFVQVTNLGRVLRRLHEEHGLWLVGTAGEAEMELYDVDLTGPLGIVMGGEGKGLRRLTREHCDQLVRLPMAGRVESLNVSVATGISLYEAVRQRHCAKPA